MKRREFIKKTAVSTMAFSLSGLILSPSISNASNDVIYNISADSEYKHMIDGSTIFTWSFNNPSSPGPGNVGSSILATEGDTIQVNLTNNLDREINFIIQGLTTDQEVVLPNETKTYAFTASDAGTYMYTDDINGFISKSMGLFGALIVMPKNKTDTLYTNGPSFDKQYTLIMSDMDSRLNEAISNGERTYNIDNYEPNYYFANSLIYPDTKEDDETLITMQLGESVAIRFINASVIEYPMHFHGYHVDVIKHNNTLINDFVSRDTVLVRPNTTAEVILPVNQKGAYPLHTHYVPGVTLNGVYANPYGGSLIIMVAS